MERRNLKGDTFEKEVYIYDASVKEIPDTYKCRLSGALVGRNYLHLFTSKYKPALYKSLFLHAKTPDAMFGFTLELSTKYITKVRIPNGVISQERLDFLNEDLKYREGFPFELTINRFEIVRYSAYINEEQENRIIDFIDNTFLNLRKRKKMVEEHRKSQKSFSQIVMEADFERRINLIKSDHK